MTKTKFPDPVPDAHRVFEETIRISEGMRSSGEPLDLSGLPSPEERDREARKVMRRRFRRRKEAAGGRPGSA